MRGINKKGIFEIITGTGMLALACFFLVRAFFLSFSTDIWYDELFSMEFAGADIKELVSLTARDVHPPFYYIILKFFLTLSDVYTGFPAETAAKLVSIIPFILLFIYGVTVIRKQFGMVTAGVFCFTVVSMPALPEYTTEIRMYSWSIFFVTAALLHGFALMRDFEAESQKWDIINSAALLLFGVAAAYTHYYAALSIGIIYVFIFIWMLFGLVARMRGADKKGVGGFKALAALIICGNLTIVAYIPWLGALFSQIGTVKESYWIQPVGIRTVGSCIKYMFSGYFNNNTITVIIAVLLFAFSAIMFVYTAFMLHRTRQMQYAVQLIAFSVTPALVIAGIIASVLIRPVFVGRYIVPSLGAFYLAVSIGIGSINKKKIFSAAFLLMIIVVGCVDFRAFIGNEEYRKINMDRTIELFESLDSDAVIISNFNHVQALLAYYLNSGEYSDGDFRIYLYYSEPEKLIAETVDGLYTIEDSIDIYNYLLAGKEVLFLGSFNSREVLLEEWNSDYGITYENKGSYLMERYWFDVFELGLGTGAGR